MEPRGVELIGVMQLDNRGMKECLIRAIFGPPIVPLVPVRVVEFLPVGFQLFPLHAGVKDIQDVMKDFVE